MSGTFAAGLNVLLLWLLTAAFGIWYLGASALAFSLSVGCNFLLQRLWTFRGASGAKLHQQFVLFVALNLFNLALNTALVYCLVEWLRISAVISQLISSAAIAIESYYAYRAIFSAALGANVVEPAPSQGERRE